MFPFNRTSMESKHVLEEYAEDTRGVPFNRTSMESKHRHLQQVCEWAVTFNRTSMESKHITGSAFVTLHQFR